MEFYEQNATLKLLGKQYPLRIINDDARKDIINVITAYRQKQPYLCFDNASDLFIMGFIYGQRAERAKKQRGSRP